MLNVWNNIKIDVSQYKNKKKKLLLYIYISKIRNKGLLDVQKKLILTSKHSLTFKHHQSADKERNY